MKRKNLYEITYSSWLTRVGRLRLYPVHTRKHTVKHTHSIYTVIKPALRVRDVCSKFASCMFFRLNGVLLDIGRVRPAATRRSAAYMSTQGVPIYLFVRNYKSFNNILLIYYLGQTMIICLWVCPSNDFSRPCKAYESDKRTDKRTNGPWYSKNCRISRCHLCRLKH